MILQLAAKSTGDTESDTYEYAHPISFRNGLC